MVSDLRIEQMVNGKYRVSVDGKTVHARSLNLRMDPDSFPSAEIEIQPSEINYHGIVDAEFHLHPRSTNECASGIAFELKINQKYRERFIEAIKSVLDDSEAYQTDDDMAESILWEIEQCLHTR